MENKPNSVIAFKASLSGTFFKAWLEFLSPLHKLTKKEIVVLAALLKERYELSKVIKDEEVLDKYTMNYETRQKVKDDCGISQTHFQVIMTSLKKNKVIEDGRINPKFIPKVDENAKTFQLLLLFNLQ